MSFPLFLPLSVGLLISVSGCLPGMADTTVKIDPAVRQQTFEGWGVSLAWWAKVVGDSPEPYRSEYMEKIFDPDKGLGFNIVRYNIGGGEDPALKTMTYRTRMDGFEPSPGTWNWEADVGQRWVLHDAKTRGVTIFEAFSNSPPYWMTESGSVTGAKVRGHNNLAEAHEKDFADYLVATVQHFQAHEGITFRTLEPLNEPTGDWWVYNNWQEGCFFDRPAQARILQLVGQKLAAIQSPTRLSASDENSIDDALTSLDFYPPTTLAFISQVNTHSYSGNRRADLLANTTHLQKKLWMSEYGDGETSGLDLAKRIRDDLRGMHPSAWIYWQAVDANGWGLLKEELKMPVQQEPKTTKKYWVMANYTRFIRPGAVFVAIDDENSVATLSTQGDQLAIVTINDEEKDKNISYDLSRFKANRAALSIFRTSPNENLTEVNGNFITNSMLKATLPPHSVTTFVIRGIAKRP